MTTVYVVEHCPVKLPLPGFDPNGPWRMLSIWTTKPRAYAAITPEMRQSETACYRVTPVKVQE